MTIVRAVVADDSHFMRSVISDILEDGGIEVIAVARNGREAVDAVVEHEPDVLTMDVEMSRLKDQLVDIVVSVASVDVGDRSGGASSTPTASPDVSADDDESFAANPTLVIGSSTGGPVTLPTVTTAGGASTW